MVVMASGRSDLCCYHLVQLRLHSPIELRFPEVRYGLSLIHIYQVPDFEKIEVGMKLFLQGPGGMPVPVTVVEVSPEGVKLDACLLYTSRCV